MLDVTSMHFYLKTYSLLILSNLKWKLTLSKNIIKSSLVIKNIRKL